MRVCRYPLNVVLAVVAVMSGLLPMASAVAQGSEDSPAFRRAITQAYERLPDGTDADRTWEDGEAAFLELVAAYPEIGEAYYHLACCYGRWAQSLEGADQARRLQQALAQLSRAVELGYRDLAHMSQDSDMTLLRETDDYAALLQRMEELALEEARAEAGPLEYLTWVPASAAGEGEDRQPVPLLVVLHEDGSSPDMEREAWESRCEALGVAWLGIRGPREVAAVRGVRTFGWERNNVLTTRILATITAAREDALVDVVDTDRIWLLGHRQGAYWALATAIENPELANRVVLLNAALDRTTFPAAGLRDLRSRVAIFAASTTTDTLGHDACRDVIERIFAEELGLDALFQSLDGGPDVWPFWGAIRRGCFPRTMQPGG